jgi:hypothetical protein
VEHVVQREIEEVPDRPPKLRKRGEADNKWDDNADDDDRPGEPPAQRSPLIIAGAISAVAVVVFVGANVFRGKKTRAKRLELAAAEEPLLHNEEGQ